jgi:hypothetical protein
MHFNFRVLCNIENYSNIHKSFEKVKYSIKTQLRKVATENNRNKFKEKLSNFMVSNNSFLFCSFNLQFKRK